MLDKILHKTLNLPYRLFLRTIQKSEKPRATVILLHGLASTNQLWNNLRLEIPVDADILAVDLLGHGNSPKPSWEGAQTLKSQARALRRALRTSGHLSRPIFLVGHSLGSLVSAEFAKLYPSSVDFVVMVSPPIYLQNSKSEDAWSRESFLKENYQYLVENQDFASKIAKIATEKVIRGASQIKTDQDLHLLAETLDLSILQQDTFQTLENTTTKTQIIYGLFDPLVISKNIKKLEELNTNISTTAIPTAHDVSDITANVIVRSINENLTRSKND